MKVLIVLTSHDQLGNTGQNLASSELVAHEMLKMLQAKSNQQGARRRLVSLSILALYGLVAIPAAVA